MTFVLMQNTSLPKYRPLSSTPKAAYLPVTSYIFLTSETCQLTVFIVFSYRRLSDVMCADRHWKLVYRWISAHITLLAEHPPISGSFLFFFYKHHPCQSVQSVFVVSRETGKWKSQRLKKTYMFSPHLFCYHFLTY